MKRKRLIITLLSVFVILLSLTMGPKSRAQPVPAHPYKVYKVDGSVVTLVPSKQHPLVFFATWCPHCQQDLGNKTDPNAYYIDTFTRESNSKESFKAVQDFIKTYHADSDLNRYFVSVEQHPQGVPHVPYVITQ